MIKVRAVARVGKLWPGDWLQQSDNIDDINSSIVSEELAHCTDTL